MKKITKGFLWGLALVSVLAACKKKEYESIQSVDSKKISDYISANNLAVSKSDSGYYYQIESAGKGRVLKYSDSIAYQMTIKSFSGATFFQSNKYAPTELLLGYFPFFIPVQQTLYGIPNGSTVRVVLPSHMAFGLNGYLGFGIGANENLDVQVKTSVIANRVRYEDSLINLYIKDKNISNVVKTEEGVYVSVIAKGDGVKLIGAESNITANYTLRNLGYDIPVEASTLTSSLSTLIKGWSLVLAGQSKGVKLRCFIPSRYAYGDGKSIKTGTLSSNMANVVLDYDIEVTDITD